MCLCERWSPHKMTTLIKKPDKHLSYFVSRMSFGCYFLFIFFLRLVVVSVNRKRQIYVPVQHIYVWTVNKHDYEFWTVSRTKCCVPHNYCWQPCVCVGACVCSCSCYILKTKMLILLPKQQHFFSVVDSFGSCPHLPLWSFIPLVFFFFFNPGWEGLLPGLLSAHLQLITWLLHLGLKTQSPDSVLRQSLVSLQWCLLGSVRVLLLYLPPGWGLKLNLKVGVGIGSRIWWGLGCCFSNLEPRLPEGCRVTVGGCRAGIQWMNE